GTQSAVITFLFFLTEDYILDLIVMTVEQRLLGVLTATDCLSPIFGTAAAHYSFRGTAGQQVVVTAGATGGVALALLRADTGQVLDRKSVGEGKGGGVAGCGTMLVKRTDPNC